jgi:hypothetical protein
MVVVSLLLLIGISFTQRQLDNSIAKNNLHFTGQINNAPPIVAFTTVALGSFRGLLADLLWLRAASLQESGNYFEMVQLASWITKLQPRFSGATAYLAWNMAYNISVTCSSFEDRWRWIQEGIKLVRDEALEYNPTDPLLYKELAWIFQHKLGNVLDDANLFYKNRLAILLTQIVGSDPDWAVLAKTPTTTESLFKDIPESVKFDELIQKSKYETFDKLFEEFKKQSKLPEDFVTSLNNPKISELLTRYFQVRWLKEKLKLNPVLINDLNNKYGMLDWRTPEAQAIYWATVGIDRTVGKRDLSCERLITQSLKESFIAGRIMMIDKDKFETIIVVPNFAVLDSVLRTFEEAYEKNDKLSTFFSAKINFMAEAIVLLYNYGKFAKANEFYKLMRKEEPGKYRKSLEEFVMAQWTEEVRDASVKKATDIVSGMIYRSCNYLIYGDDDAAVANERMARYIYTTYQQNNADVKVRVGLAPYRDIKNSVVSNLLKNYPPAISEILKQRLKEDSAQKNEAEARAPDMPPIKVPGLELPKLNLPK